MKAASYKHNRIEIAILLDKGLLEEIDLHNPFSGRNKFWDQACKSYLQELRRKRVGEKLAAACSDAAHEDISVNEEWEGITLEDWK